MNNSTLYSHSSVGGMGMINLENFTTALKTSWVRRYVIDKLDDHWDDLVDSHLGALGFCVVGIGGIPNV